MTHTEVVAIADECIDNIDIFLDDQGYTLSGSELDELRELLEEILER